MRVPLLNFEGGPRVLLLNFEGGPGVPLLNFRGVPGHTFKLWGVFRVPRPASQGSEVPDPGVLVPLLHHADFNKVSKHFWNQSSVWVLSCKFAVYFLNTFS